MSRLHSCLTRFLFLSGCLLQSPGVALAVDAAASHAPADSVPGQASSGGSTLCAEATLCARLGGVSAVREIAATLIDRAVDDPRTHDHWQRVDLKRVKSKLADFLCVLTGGACPYENDDLRTIHAGLHIRSGEFYALVELLRSVLDARGVRSADKNALLALLAPDLRDVVQP
ncbi:MAG: group 1 truncated hemoglobin [Pseudomonadota bacterium]|nr:group 1 truncated hemoglobin [Pseudomonadota bacterium]